MLLGPLAGARCCEALSVCPRRAPNHTGEASFLLWVRLAGKHQRGRGDDNGHLSRINPGKG